ncbi:MAG: bifunctional 3,4-dihydroxy-2-butanone-4-phosphate synthase/GTP cyclohydrolase II [Burkholderiaceae bacterium]
MLAVVNPFTPSAPSAVGAISISPVPEIVAELAAGRMVILVDEEDRENEGDLVLAADFVTSDAINFMARYGRGLICLTLTEERTRQLQLPLMTAANGTRYGTKFTMSIEAAEGVTTGISAADRARTVQAAVARDAKPADIVQPGHIFPIRAEAGGVLMRAGHTEAGCDLARMAGTTPASVICEILKDDGTMARLPDLMIFAQQHSLKIGTIADLIHYRSANESLIERVAERVVSTAHGALRAIAYRDLPSGSAHVALTHGTIDPEQETLVRVHEPTSLLDLLDDGTSTHSWTVARALAAVAKSESGVLVLLNANESADRLFGQFDSLAEVDRTGVCRETHVERKMDLRTYGIGAQILRDLGVGRMRLMAKPRKMPSMAGYDLRVCGYVDP